MTDYILIAILIIALFLLNDIKKELERIRHMAEMTEREKHMYNLSIEDPETYNGVLESEATEKNNNL